MARFAADLLEPVPTVAPTGAPNARENIPTSPAMFGGLAAQAEEKLGAGIENVGEAGLSYAQATQQIDNSMHAANVHSWLSDNLNTGHSTYADNKGQAALNALNDRLKTIDDNVQQAINQAPSPREKEMVAIRVRLQSTISPRTKSYARHARRA